MAFEINANEIVEIEIANWNRQPHSETLALTYNYNQQRGHVWSASVMSMANWKIIDALRGQYVTLETTSPSSRNGVTVVYPRAKLVRLSGSHVAEHYEDVEVEFQVEL